MFRGITSLSAPPVSLLFSKNSFSNDGFIQVMGAIRDITESFNIPFVIGGISFITSALMHFFLMWINSREKTNTKNTKDKSEIGTSPSALEV